MRRGVGEMGNNVPLHCMLCECAEQKFQRFFSIDFFSSQNPPSAHPRLKFALVKLQVDDKTAL